MPKLCELDDDGWWQSQRDRVIGLGERSFHKSYYPELRRSLSRLERFRALLDFAGEMVLLVTLPGGQVIDANVAAAEILGQSVPDLVGRRLSALGFARADRILDALGADAAGGESPSRQDEVMLEIEGRSIPIDLVCRVAILEGVTYGILLGRDASHRIAAEARLRLAARVFADSGEGIMVANRRSCIVELNRAFEHITGYDRSDVLGKPLSFLGSRRHAPGLYRRILKSLSLNDYWQGEFWTQRKNRETYPVWLSLSVIRDEQGRASHFVAMFSDISEDKANEARIEYMAHHDFLTGLPNRFLLNDRLAQLLVAARRNHTRFGVLFIDLDRFKNVNDTLGHKAGDRLLCLVAERLAGLLRPSDTVSRQGGDEFIVLLTEIEGPAEAAHIANRLLLILSEPCVIDGHELTITPSIGIAIGPDDGADIDTLLKHADLAMYQVKQQGRNHCQFFSPEMTVRMLELLQMEKHLRLAVKRQEFQLCYQPQVDLALGVVVAVEALIRWHQPERGLVSPVDFIPLAEETRLILPVGEWVLREACRQVAEWRRGQWPAIRVAVNLSAVQFQQGDLAAIVRSALVDHGLAADALELEVTESLLMQDAPATVQNLRELQSMGVALAIDDFGTGYSSLAYLKQLPVSRLKIDRSFVRDLTDDRGDAAICAAIIGLAGNLNLDVVAEGVETADQLEWLRQAGCDLAQGFLLGRPMTAEDCMAWLAGSFPSQGLSAG
jgi:diguanylate cyclase (GGDEF)-like protein/PAS domain S-box-containing protein